MPTLRSTLNALAANLASDILDVIRGSSLEELLGTTGGAGHPRTVSGGARAAHATGSGRLKRRSAEEIAEALDQVVALVKKSKEGLRAEQIRHQLDLQAKEVSRILKEGLATKKLKAKGQKRATTYTTT